MIYRIETIYRNLKRFLSRSEWMVFFHPVSNKANPPEKKGLIIVQIDGLSRSQFEKAIRNNKMPFLRHLHEHEHYSLHSLYSGMPSSTPSVQAELFYGVKTVVPAFSFKNHATGEILRMFESKAVRYVEDSLDDASSQPLLKNGSSYSNVYSGGATEINFCPESPGWDGFFAKAGIFPKTLFILSHSYSFMRVAILLVLECVIALSDVFRGLISRKNFFKEISFVPIRVAICILLRELITIGVKFDITRNLPIIHLNLLGYDEQAHRRGPSSKFAHWTLKGIDDAISRIARQAMRSSALDYDIWVYSDHGQEETKPYAKIHGLSLEQAVHSAYFQRRMMKASRFESLFERGIESIRVQWLGGKYLQKLSAKIHQNDSHKTAGIPPHGQKLDVVAMGPVGFVYFQNRPDDHSLEDLARRLVCDYSVPVTMVYIKGILHFWCADGKFSLPGDSHVLMGEKHPFLADVTEDLMALCHHKDAGDLVMLGWRYGNPCITFPIENGSHAGPGYEETHAFALLPADAPLPDTAPAHRKYLKIGDIRQAALTELGRVKKKEFIRRPQKISAASPCFRLMTYNVHSCLGMDGKTSPQRIARIIGLYQPDVIALQELDACKPRSGYLDQAHEISDYLNLNFHFHPVIHVEEEQYGDAILTHHPMKIMKASNLSKTPYKPSSELRGAIWAAININGINIHLFNTHLGLSPKEQLLQSKILFSHAWIQHHQCCGPTILCGDFNAIPRSRAYRYICRHFHDAQLNLKNHRPLNTFFSRYPKLRIDHVFTNTLFTIDNITIPRTLLTRVASDHLPMIVDLNIAIENERTQCFSNKGVSRARHLELASCIGAEKTMM